MNINLVFSGGEMRGGYVGGFLLEFVSTFFDKGYKYRFYCVSASVPTVLYFLSHGDYSRELYLKWKEHLYGIWSDQLSFETNNISNTKYFLDVDRVVNVFRANPYNVENILKSKHRIVFPVFNIDLYKLEYFSNKKEKNHLYMGDYNIYDVINAAIAAPIVYGKSITLGGFRYCDPGMVEHFILPEDKNKTIFVPQNMDDSLSKLRMILLGMKALISRNLFLNYFFIKSDYHNLNRREILKGLHSEGKVLFINCRKKLKGLGKFNLTRNELKTNIIIGAETFQKNKDNILDYLLQ